jgi:hypothetical protein
MKTIYAIPGLNTTKEIYDYLELKDVNLVVLDWPAPVKHETMQTYAKSFVEKIDLSKPFYLLGVSFGGMLCVEIAKQCSPEKTIIVSSAKGPHEFPIFFKLTKFLCWHLIPTEKMYMRFIPKQWKKIGLGKELLAKFIEMVNNMPPFYYRRLINCIVKWKTDDKKIKNLVHIHGTADRILPYKFVTCDYTIEGGTHAMIVYKAKEISELINKEIQ